MTHPVDHPDHAPIESSSDTPALIDPALWTVDLDDPNDPVLRLQRLITQLDALKPKSATTPAPERERLLITLVLSVLADPTHPVGQPLARALIKRYLDRGGRLPIRGSIANSMRDPDEFDFAVTYLLDWRCTCGKPMRRHDVAMALGCGQRTINERALERHRAALAPDEPAA